MFPIWNLIWNSAFVLAELRWFCECEWKAAHQFGASASASAYSIGMWRAVDVEGPLFRGTVVGVLVAAGSNSAVRTFRLCLVSGVSERAHRMRSVLIGRIWFFLHGLHQAGLAGRVLRLWLFAGAEQRGSQAETRRRQVLHVTVVHQSGEEEQEEEQEERQQGDAAVVLNVFSRGVKRLGACG